MNTRDILNWVYDHADFSTDEGKTFVELAEDLCAYIDSLSTSKA